jgi:hypothetical protein
MLGTWRLVVSNATLTNHSWYFELKIKRRNKRQTMYFGLPFIICFLVPLPFQGKGFWFGWVKRSALVLLKGATRTNTTRIFRPKTVGQKMGLNRFATSLNPLQPQQRSALSHTNPNPGLQSLCSLRP